MAKTQKILMLIENESGIEDDRVWPEATTLRDHGYQVSIICPKGTSDSQERNLYVEGIHVYHYRVPMGANTFTSYLVEYIVSVMKMFLLSFKVWYRHGFDVIHVSNPPDLLFPIGWFYRIFGKKYIFDQHDLTPELFRVKFKDRKKLIHRLLLFLEKCSYQTAHIVITTNLSQKRFAIERGCHPDKIFIVRNGPDVKRIKSVTLKPELKRGRRYLLAYVGVMDVQDGVEYALLALDDLVHKRGRQDVSLVLMGSGDNATPLHALAHKLELDDYVNFTGWVKKKDLVCYLTMADIGLVPDPQNGLNEYSTMIKTMEYMAMGKAVVGFDLAETRFSAQDAGLYATPNLVEDLANKIETLLDDEELRLKMGALGRKRVEEALSWDHSKTNLLRAYEALFQQENALSVSDATESDPKAYISKENTIPET